MVHHFQLLVKVYFLVHMHILIAPTPPFFVVELPTTISSTTISGLIARHSRSNDLSPMKDKPLYVTQCSVTHNTLLTSSSSSFLIYRWPKCHWINQEESTHCMQSPIPIIHGSTTLTQCSLTYSAVATNISLFHQFLGIYIYLTTTEPYSWINTADSTHLKQSTSNNLGEWTMWTGM